MTASPRGDLPACLRHLPSGGWPGRQGAPARCDPSPGADGGARRSRDAPKVRVEAVECLSVCKRPCTIAVSGPGRWTYIYGDLSADTSVETILDGLRRYAATSDGLVPWRERPEAFRKGVVARIPPFKTEARPERAAERQAFMSDLAKIPCTIITGFLGAGKTTLVRHLLENAGGRRLAVLVNEFGDLGFDGSFIEGCGIEGCTQEDIVELPNGCICCTVADDFVPALNTLLNRPEPARAHPDRNLGPRPAEAAGAAPSTGPTSAPA